MSFARDMKALMINGQWLTGCAMASLSETLDTYFKERLKEFNGEPPGVLYHYTSADGMNGILSSGVMHAGNADSFDDGIELRYAASVFSAHVARRYARSKDPRQTMLYDGIRKLIDLTLDPVFILSFTANGNDRTHWELYADRGTGFSFAIDFQDTRGFILQNDKARGYPLKCIYDDALLDRFCEDVLAEICKIYAGDVIDGTEQALDCYARELLQRLQYFSPVFKYKVREDEREWRLVVISKEQSERRPKRKKGSFICLPPAKIKEPLPIKAICAGPNCDFDVEMPRLMKTMAENGYSGVRLVRSTLEI